eukprot:TRINITY_DN24474_c0_g1_i3.p2 TRINITY_DN24474_c0_g1~~TRINITY_DN24474_c0_g1_i3.p2  ORF type:complete len:115 (+),score=18.47 TRINITY_DN24474_c0_g1_i3:606-950(+)
MCLPRNLTREQQLKRCELIEGYASKLLLESYIESMNVVGLILVLAGGFVLVYGLTMVVYYNYRFYKDGEPPFPAFGWCPQFIFPRARSSAPANERKESANEKEPVGYYLYEFDD